ncbi:hypothetical protein PtB15_17B436 [Puccinia triticina]|nr:hypothetical protein PtB15_17B436 [Puccinia triticina]
MIALSRSTAPSTTLVLREEVCDLKKVGILAIKVFKLAPANVKDRTQNHSHFCCSYFNKIMTRKPLL